jgi:deferrochelatase/peroxidase EfeB
VRARTRRQFIAAAGAAGVGATLGSGTPAARAAEAARTGAPGGKAVPFYGAHQAGIATPTQEHVHFLALDVVSDSSTDLRALLAALSAGAAALTAGNPVGALSTGVDPPVDTGEALGLGPSRLTVTFGLGPSVFAAGRFGGLEALRPAPLVDLPPFASDSLQPGICDGDIAVQACSDDPQVAFHAIHDLIRLASPTAVPRWSLPGFGRTLNTAGRTTPRNIMGFKEGTANIVGQDHAALERFVWAGAPESPTWMVGGSYMVVRRIQMLLRNWDSISLEQQERTFGRRKLSGAPLGQKHEHDPIDLHKVVGGQLAIPPLAHIRVASPAYNHGQRLLRRGYSYSDGIYDGAVAGGQLFICFQRDPRAQFIPMQNQLALSDLLNEHTEHIGSAIFACPPGATGGRFVGEGLFG